MGRGGIPTDPSNGLRLFPLPNGNEIAVILGSVDRRGERSGPWTPIPILKSSLPVLSRDYGRAYSGTIAKVDTEKGGKRLVLKSRDPDDNALYVHLQTGFNMDRWGNIDGAINQLLIENPDDFKISVPGSFSLDGASVQMESVEGLEFSEEKATRMRWSTSKVHKLIGAPGVRHDLWRIPVGAAVLAQDVNGIIFRVIHEKGGSVRIAEASAYAQVFDDFEQRRQTEARKRRESRLLRDQEKFAVRADKVLVPGRS